MRSNFRTALLLAGIALPQIALAQSPPPYSQSYAPQTDADILAAQMRQLAENPQDIYALIAAGNLTLKMGDGQAAAALFARAEKVDPNNARVKAGMAATLVQSERPGEALRLYAQASSLGVAEREFGSDRGLAYDLIGDQGRAQRDYRAMLLRGNDDETVRRYALSLGISGQKDRALSLLEPLNRKSDRGAWRARAFVLAMNGDRAGAEKIATGMMPPGMAAGLRPFFDRLPRLSAIDRAFAVHFGEVRGTPARYADISLAPRLTPMPVEAAPVAVAAMQRPAAALSKKEQRRLEREVRKRGRAQRVVVAATAPTPAPLPIPPAPSASELARVAPILSTPYAYPVPARTPPPASRPQIVETKPAVRAPAPTASAALDAAADPFESATKAAMPAPTAKPPAPAPVAIAAATVSKTPFGPAFDGRVATPAAEAKAIDAPVAAAPAPVEIAAVPATPVASIASEPAPLVLTPSVAPVVSLGKPPAPAGPKGDAILAAIVARISVPDSELTPTSARAKPGAKTVDAKVAVDPKKVAADKAKADVKAKADAKAKAEKAKNDPAKLEPSRIWVQVAGGANESTLGKEWARASAQAAALKGKQGWTTPLRATNRVLTGPFKTSGEAMALVNTLKKQGVNAFMFTSEAGQKISRLGAK